MDSIEDKQYKILNPEGGRRIALVVGVNASPDSGKSILQNSVAGAKAIAETLQSPACNFELPENNYFLEHMATSDAIKLRIMQLAKEVTEKDSIIFYYNGHGVAMHLEEKEESEDIYLATHNFDPELVNEDNSYYISFNWLREKLYDRYKAERVLIILDCCYSGNFGDAGPFMYVNNTIRRYFEHSEQSQKNNLRQTLAATGHNQEAYESDKYGLLTEQILPALKGEVHNASDDDGNVTLIGLCHYLEPIQSHLQHFSLSGHNAGKSYILSYDPQKNLLLQSKRPQNHIALTHRQYPSFRPRSGEFELLESMLLKTPRTTRLGLIGMPGIGKSELAAQIALKYKEKFTDGIFGIIVENTSDWTGLFAELAEKTHYLLEGNKTPKISAHHICTYLATHINALLILDDVAEPDKIPMYLQSIAGEDLKCTILYTSRTDRRPDGYKIHILKELPIEIAKSILMEKTSSESLSQDEMLTLEHILHHVGGLPLALLLLQSRLNYDHSLTYTKLLEMLQRKGAEPILNKAFQQNKPLWASLKLTWDKVEDKNAKKFFILASYFQRSSSIPVRFIGIACGFGLDDYLDTYNARISLQEHFLVEFIEEDLTLKIHPLVREFGQSLANEEDIQLLKDAAHHISDTFMNLLLLEEYTEQVGYLDCIEDIQLAIGYIQNLGQKEVQNLSAIKFGLEQEKELLNAQGLWPQRFPGLFYQQMYNRIFEDGQTTIKNLVRYIWLRQTRRIGINTQTSERSEYSTYTNTLRQNEFIDLSISKQGNRLLTYSTGTILNLWDVNEKKIIQTNFRGNNARIGAVISCSTLNISGSLLAIGNDKGTIEIWKGNSDQLLKTLGETNVEVKKNSDHRVQAPCVNQIQFLHDDTQIIAAYQDGSIRIWDFVESGKEDSPIVLNNPWEKIPDEEKGASVPEVYIAAISSMALSTYENKVATGTEYGEISICDISNQGSSIVLSKDTNFPITALTFSSDESSVLSSSEEPTTSAVESTIVQIRLWDTAEGKLYGMLEGHTALVTVMSFSPDGKLLLTCDRDGWARLWKVHSSTEYDFIGIYKAQNSIGAVSWLNDRRFILVDTGGASNRPYFYHLEVEGLTNDIVT